jgi:hypothetical protein
MRKNLKPRLIIVLGMHRAGTSAVTRALEVLDVSLGSNLMPASEHVNPKGFFEDLEVNALNIDMLGAIGSDWSRVSPISTSQLDLLKQGGFFRHAADLIQAKCRDTPVFGLKDPRISKLLPFWNQVFDSLEYDVAFVVALRNPLSIAKSLEKRDGFQASHSFFLWLGHMLESLRGSAGRPRMVIDYDQLIRSPEVQVKRMAATLSLKVDESALEAYAKEFIDRNLRHTIYTNEELLTESGCPALIKEMFAWLLQAATEQISLEDKRFREASQAWFKEFERLKVSLELIDDQLGHIDRLHREASDRDKQIAQLSQSRLTQEADIVYLNQRVADQNITISNLTDKTETLEQWGLRLQRDLNLARTIELQIMNSKSWRLTRPLRDARRWLTNLK